MKRLHYYLASVFLTSSIPSRCFRLSVTHSDFTFIFFVSISKFVVSVTKTQSFTDTGIKVFAPASIFSLFTFLSSSNTPFQTMYLLLEQNLDTARLPLFLVTFPVATFSSDRKIYAGPCLAHQGNSFVISPCEFLIKLNAKWLSHLIGSWWHHNQLMHYFLPSKQKTKRSHGVLLVFIFLGLPYHASVPVQKLLHTHCLKLCMKPCFVIDTLILGVIFKTKFYFDHISF